MSKMRSWTRLVIAAASAALQACTTMPGSASFNDFGDKLMQLGAGPEGGSFEAIGKAVCDTLNESRKVLLVRCVPVRSAGSVFNIHALAEGSIQLGLGQEDLVGLYAEDGIKGGRHLRAVGLMHDSPIGIVVRKELAIQHLAQIRGHVVNRGNKGSSIYANADAVLRALRLDDKDFKGVTFLPPVLLVKAFCAGEIDVVFNALADPSDHYRQLISCGGEFLDIPAEIQQRMMASDRWLRPMEIPAGMYRPDQPVVRTIGMRNLLLTRADVDEEAVFRVASLLREQHTALQTQEPLLATMRKLTAEDVGRLAVSLHPGAQRAMLRARP